MFIVVIPSDAFTTMLFPFIFSESGPMVDLRSVSLPVSTLRGGDSLVNRRTYTWARGPVLGPQVHYSWKNMMQEGPCSATVPLN